MAGVSKSHGRKSRRKGVTVRAIFGRSDLHKLGVDVTQLHLSLPEQSKGAPDKAGGLRAMQIPRPPRSFPDVPGEAGAES